MTGIYDDRDRCGYSRPDFPPKHVRDTEDAANEGIAGIYDDGGVYGFDQGPDCDSKSARQDPSTLNS